MLRYPHISVLIVPAAQKATAETFALALTDAEPGTGQTYRVPLSPSGIGEPTAWGCCTVVDAAMLAEMFAVLQSGALPGLLFWRWESETTNLVSTNCAVSHQSVGLWWDWEKCLRDAGLFVVAPDFAEGQ